MKLANSNDDAICCVLCHHGLSCPSGVIYIEGTIMASHVPSRSSLARVDLQRSVFDLERILYSGKTIRNHADEVWPKLYLGDQTIAANKRELCHMRITHILNASHSRWRGGEEYYKGMNIMYMGIEALDFPTYDMSVHFYPAAEFIHRALVERGRILVHCAMGVSRSATLVLAYLMIYHRMTLVEAITTVKDQRGVFPNRGFLRQLLHLDCTLRRNH
ncbi:dual specificity protein phosphatase 26 isoform X1 [Pseudophryne corroboree]|uniref:dual specificity protein phosphatase 26 isoform X1 n=2 Tax=Pseudophryne corroboree TaxID=495146 RepID=UPI003081951E